MIDFTKISNDSYGNPRYVCHYLAIADDYDLAIKLANMTSGKKYTAKSYGGGIAFTSYNLRELNASIESVKADYALMLPYLSADNFTYTDSNGKVEKWRRNGKNQMGCDGIRIPVKYGLKTCAYITLDNRNMMEIVD